MNFTNIIIEQLLKLWFVIPILIILAIFKTAWLEGVVGEFLVNFMTQWRLNLKTAVERLPLPQGEGWGEGEQVGKAMK